MQGVHKIHQDFKWKDFVSTIVTRKGDTINIRLPRNGEATRLKTDEYWGIPLPQNREMVEFKYLNDSISYLNIKSFYPEDIVISEIDKNLDKIYKSKGLIIDLRKNGGGVTNVAWYLQSLLSKDKFFLNYSWETRVNDGVKRANSNWKDEYKGYSENQEVRFVEADTIFIPDSIRRIEVPVVILIGKYTFSAAEDFLVNLYEVPNRPTLVGQETGGSTGSPLVVSNLPYQGICRICTRRICFPYSGKRFVNQGIKPDVIVQETIDDILHGNDIALNKALEFFSIK